MTAPLSKILHIDDDTVMRMMVVKALERSQKGFQIKSCVTVSEFLEAVPTFQPDLLVVDVLMPILNGPTLISRLRSQAIMTPVVFMTGQDDPVFENRDQLEPIIGIIRKPFSPLQLGDDLISLWQKHCG